MHQIQLSPRAVHHRKRVLDSYSALITEHKSVLAVNTPALGADTEFPTKCMSEAPLPPELMRAHSALHAVHSRAEPMVLRIWDRKPFSQTNENKA